jgi:hypothetical protein
MRIFARFWAADADAALPLPDLDTQRAGIEALVGCVLEPLGLCR